MNNKEKSKIIIRILNNTYPKVPIPLNYKNIFITEDFDDATYVDYVKDENQHLFDMVIKPCLIIRGSFICTQYKYLKESAFQHAFILKTYGLEI